MYDNLIFFSYTLSDGEITKDTLLEIKKVFSEYVQVRTYFDVLDNCADNHQEYVCRTLEKADILCLIISKNIKSSLWVGKELYLARKKNIPIIEIYLKDIEQILKSTSKDDFLQNLKVREIMWRIEKN